MWMWLRHFVTKTTRFVTKTTYVVTKTTQCVTKTTHFVTKTTHSINVQNSFFTYEENKIINLPEKLWNVSTLINKEAVKSKIN